MANNPDIVSVDEIVEWARNEVQYQMAQATSEDQERIQQAVTANGIESMVERHLDWIAESMNICY